MDGVRRRLESQLCKAVKNGEPRSVQLLLSQGARPDLVGSKGVAAIHLAVGKESEKNIRCLKILLEHGADPNIRSSEGLTPLHVAALWGCYRNLQLLLMNGGNPTLKDHEGNTAGKLAEQQDNRKCAHLLQDYQASSGETEEDDIPQFQYSVYSDQTDTSSYPESDYSFSSLSSRISDFGDAALSSTRRSSFFNLSRIDGRTNCGGNPNSRLSGPSLLSSTRMSAVGTAADISPQKEHHLCIDLGKSISKDSKHTISHGCRVSPSRRDTLPAFPSTQASRKSVSFRDVDEYFPVFSPESPKQQPRDNGSQSPSTLPFDMSEYSDFLDSERMVTVLPHHGIDVTSPDHVYVFCRESSESTEEDMEKTVMSYCALEEREDAQEGGDIKEGAEEAHPVPSSSSGTGSSHYSSCDSEHYTSTLDEPADLRPRVLPEVQEISTGTGKEKRNQASNICDSELMRHDVNHSTARERSENPETQEPLPGLLDKLTLSEVKHPDADGAKASDRPVEERPIKVHFDHPNVDPHEASEPLGDLSFTPSPFVTGRTNSRLSRCSMRKSNTLKSLSSTSSLFEDTLPTPVRASRHTPRSESREDFYSSPHPRCFTPSYSESTTGGDALSADSQDSESMQLPAAPSVSNSQADTFILPKNQTDSAADSQTLADTIILERNQDTSIDAYERNLVEMILAIQGRRREVAEANEFLTDDLTSAEEKTTKGNLNNKPDKNRQDDQDNSDACITDDCSSQPTSASSSSSSSYFSPRRSREDSDLPCTPGTGCTPRYSMSRLSSHCRPQHLASLSYTPGGRPLIQDLDEPVEYLYTDTEEGHRLIETHVPPTTDTSLSSSVSATSSEETILYDWRSLQTDVKVHEGKENQTPQTEEEKEGSSEKLEGLLPEARGLTDKELRRKLLEFGESPGPISSRTRPTYMRRLCRLLQDSKSQSQPHQTQVELPQKDSGYSAEMSLVLQTFRLPDCQAEEQAVCQQFDQPDQNRKWREGIIKSSFNYLLLDPRVTKNLPFRSHTMTPHECFQTFIHAIFYVGKGKRSRPYSHLYEALEYYKGDKTSKKLCPKVQHILQVWQAGQGVISLHCFQNVIPVEAYTREACMVEAIGLKMLTNQKRGDFYGVVSNWQQKKKRELGVHLLYRAMQIFLAEGERQLRPADIRQ